MVSVTNETTLVVDVASLTTTNLPYAVYKKVNLKNEAEQVNHSKITMLNKSMLTAPNITFPAYTQEGSILTLYPDTVSTIGRVVCQYISCLLYTSPSPRDRTRSRMPSSA